MADGGTTRLGPFDLDCPIGRGGMGEVWRAVHRGMGVSVAVKVMTASQVRDEGFQAAFRGEVRAVAALDHPRIIHVFDHGSVDRAAQEASEDRLLAGSPWLAMELVEGGTLEGCLARGALDWPGQLRVLLALLDALAHAHAVGVVHRDLKPANVLLRDAADPGGSLVLTDFGLAQAGEDRDSAGQTEAPSGTPQFMSPEQFEGHWRDYGPWTDLYALGCIAFHLATGSHPFQGGSMFALAFAHLQGRREPWRPLSPVPGPLEGWVDRLLRRAPGERFQRAADAAHALRELAAGFATGAVPQGPATGRPGRALARDVATSAAGGQTSSPASRGASSASLLGSAPTLAMGEVHGAASGASASGAQAWQMPTLPLPQKVTGTNLMSARTIVQQPQVPLPAVPPPIARPEDSALVVPPLPLDWRAIEASRGGAVPVLPGVGLGLFGLRSVPIQGRETERDLLWAALAEVRRTGAFRMAVLRGPAGTGKSRLAEWIARRADEVGAAMVLTARHSHDRGPGSGLGPMLARLLRCRGLDRDGIRARVAGILDAEGEAGEYETLGLTDVMSPPDEGGRATAPLLFSGPAERHGLLRRFLARVAAGRPLLLLLDDVQWGADALDFVRAQRSALDLAPAPVLVVATVRDDLLQAGSEEERLLAGLLERKEVRAIDVAPLAEGEHRQLVERLLGLRGDLAVAVARRTGGNPLFAVQLVGDWVGRGVLEPTCEGFRLRPGDDAVLPDGIHAVWTQRIGTALAGSPPQARAALQVAAALGGEIDPAEWASACALAGLEVPSDLVDRLVGAGLARMAASGGPVRPWSFEHGMLQESLARDAHDSGRWQDWHRACAAMLRRDLPDGTRGLASRLAGHLLAAGLAEEAARRWLEAAEQDLLLAEYAQSEDSVLRGEAALAAAGVPESDSRWGLFQVARLTILRHRTRLVEAEAAGREALGAARLYGWTAVEARLTGDLGDVLHQEGRLDEAEPLIRRARQMHQDLGDEAQAMANLRMLASIARIRNQLGEARRLLGQIQRFYRDIGATVQQANATRDLAMVLIAEGDTAAGIEAVAEARRAYERVGFRMGIVRCLNTQGTALYTEGRYDEAAEVLLGGIELDRQVGSGLASMLAINLAMAELGRGRFEAAELRIAPFLASARAEPDVVFTLFYEAMLLCARLGQGKTDGWEEHLRVVAGLVERTSVADRDLARILELGGRQAARFGRPDVAREILALARDQRSALGDPGAAAAVSLEIERLPRT